jgi:chromate transporter
MKISKWDIFKTFFIIGLTTFGGGYAMLGVMRHKLVEHKKWLTEDEIIELLAVSESTPGPFAVNAATFIGYRKGKFLGSFLAVLGVILPSLTISVIIGVLLTQYGEIKLLNAALKGIAAGVSAIILMAFLNLSSKHKFSVVDILIFIISVALVFFHVLSVIYIILIGAAIGIIAGLIKTKMSKDKEEEEESEDDVTNNA